MHIDVVKMNEWGKKRGLSEWTWFLSTWLLMPDALQAWEFNKLLIYWDIHTGTTVSSVYRGWSKAKRVENALLMSCWCQRSKWSDWLKKWKGNCHSNNHWLPPRSAEYHLWAQSTSDLEAVCTCIHSLTTLQGAQYEQGTPNRLACKCKVSVRL